MKKISILFSIVIGFNVIAQNVEKQMDDANRITLAAYVPEKIVNMPKEARASLSNKLSQIITQNGFAGSSSKERFVLTTNIVELSKDVTSSAPAMHAYTLELTLYIGDAVSGTKFSSYTVKLKGVAETETKAYLNALKNLKVKDEAYQEFVELGKIKIVEYYNSQCEFILKEAHSYEERNEYAKALFTLTSVPNVCKECYDKCLNMIKPIYQRYIDYQCKNNLNEASMAWNTNLNAKGAKQASQYLRKIEPNSACFPEAQKLVAEIGKRIKELDKREWDFKLKQQQDSVDIQKANLKAIRDILVAYGENQPDIRYETVVYGWW